MNTSPVCRTVTVVTFRGDSFRPHGVSLTRLLDDGLAGRGPGPTPLQCLLYTGHTGVSTDDGATIFAPVPCVFKTA